MGTAMRVGMLGLGRMGLPMANHMVAAGHEVMAFDVHQPARERAAAAGVPVVDSASELAGMEFICSSLPATDHVEAAYFGDDLVGSLGEGTVCADLSTISISASRRLAERCAASGVNFLDTPVSGTSIHAEAGTLVIMAGGSEPAFDRIKPALESFATRVDRVGDNGAGLELKLITNRLLTTHLAAIGEAVLMLEQTDLDIEQALELLRAGAVPRLLDYKADPMTKRDYSPQFTVDLMAKDLRLADEDLAPMPLSAASREVVDAASEAGHGDADLTAIMEILAARMHA